LKRRRCDNAGSGDSAIAKTDQELLTNEKEFSARMKLPIPAGDFRAYLFDCDGTIADSMPLHYIAWKKALAEWNCPFDEELFYSWGGKPPVEIIATLNQMNGLKMPVAEVAEHKENFYYELLPTLQPVPEVLEHIDAMQGKIPYAVVSGSTRQSIVKTLTAVHLLDRFPVLVGSEDYARSKPAPDCFLLGAERLGMAPKDCLVFEDTAMGVQAATAASMASVRVPSPLERRNGTKPSAKA
jgi:HAD superfamily hydrolase (TIGR01509 family)